VDPLGFEFKVVGAEVFDGWRGGEESHGWGRLLSLYVSKSESAAVVISAAHPKAERRIKQEGQGFGKSHCVFHGFSYTCLPISCQAVLVKVFNSNLFGMRFAIQPLRDVSNVNDFRYATEIESVAGDATDLYFQLMDSDKRPTCQSSGLRYMPPALSTLSVTFRNIDNAKVVTRYASQPFAQDPSIWKVSVLSTDPVAGTVNIKFVLTEPSGQTSIVRTTALRAAFLAAEAQ